MITHFAILITSISWFPSRIILFLCMSKLKSCTISPPLSLKAEGSRRPQGTPILSSRLHRNSVPRKSQLWSPFGQVIRESIPGPRQTNLGLHTELSQGRWSPILLGSEASSPSPPLPGPYLGFSWILSWFPPTPVASEVRPRHRWGVCVCTCMLSGLI